MVAEEALECRGKLLLLFDASVVILKISDQIDPTFFGPGAFLDDFFRLPLAVSVFEEHWDKCGFTYHTSVCCVCAGVSSCRRAVIRLYSR